MAVLRLAVFISPHGFGHAARACAVMEAIGCLHPAIRFDVFTTVPAWFLAESLTVSFDHFAEPVDVGLVQQDPMREDMEATTAALARLLETGSGRVARLAKAIRERDCAAVIADIAPVGLASASAAGVPGILLENFTWDWIYAHHPRASPALLQIGEWMARVNATAALHLQTVPVCSPAGGAVRVGPIARRPRAGRVATRRRLGIGDQERLALVSLGGVATSLAPPTRVPESWKVLLLGESRGPLPAAVRVLPHHSGIFHPDLACAADAIVGKLGYSTVAEAWQAGCALVWADRPEFPETEVLAAHVRENLPHAEIRPAELGSGDWTESLGALQPPRQPGPFRDGAEQAARAILRMLRAATR